MQFKSIRLLNACDVYQPKTIATKYFVPDGKYTVYGANGEIGQYDEYNHEEPEVLMACRGATCGTINVSKPFSWINGNAMVIHPNGTVPLRKDYLKYYLMSVSKDSIISGTAQPQITRQNLKDFQIVICDLDDQQKIVSQIEESLSQLDSAVATLNKTKQQLEIYRQAVLKEAFDISAVKQGALSDLCSSIVDCPHSTPKWTKEGKLCLRTTNFKTGYLDLSEKNYVDQETFNLRNKRLVPLPGDIVYSREGAILGIACIIPDNTYACLGQRMMVIRTSDSLNNRFLMHFLNSPKVNAYIKKMTGGSASPHVNVKDIKALQIPLFSVFQQEQMAKTIDSKLSICESIELTVNQSLQQGEALRQSILKQAFEVE